MDEQVGTVSCGLYPTSLGLAELETRRAELRLEIGQKVRRIKALHILELILQIVTQLALRPAYCEEEGGDGRDDLAG